MPTMTINCPEWLPWLSTEQMQGHGVEKLLERYAKGVRLAEFRVVFRYRYFRADFRWSRGACWRRVMRYFGYTEDAGWCYVD